MSIGRYLGVSLAVFLCTYSWALCGQETGHVHGGEHRDESSQADEAFNVDLIHSIIYLSSANEIEDLLNVLKTLDDGDVEAARELLERGIDTKLLILRPYINMAPNRRRTGVMRAIEKAYDHRAVRPRRTDQPEIDRGVATVLELAASRGQETAESTKNHRDSRSRQTNDVCICGEINEVSVSSFSPVSFIPDLNEYHLVWTNNLGRTFSRIVYYCWSCGSKLPRSTRQAFFCNVTQKEEERIKALLSPYATLGDLKKKFGEPDHMAYRAYYSGNAAESGSKRERYRGPTWKSLSKVADVQVEVNDDGSIREIEIYPKRKKGTRAMEGAVGGGSRQNPQVIEGTE